MLSGTVIKKISFAVRENFSLHKICRFESSFVLLLVLQLLFSGCALGTQEIVVEDFKSKRIPADWFVGSTRYSFEQDGLRLAEATGFVIPLPERTFEGLTVELEVELAEKAGVVCSVDGGQVLSLTFPGSKYPRHIAARHEYVIDKSLKQIREKSGPRLVRFQFDGKAMKAFVEDQEVISAVDDSAQMLTGTIQLGLPKDSVLHKIRVLGDNQSNAPLYEIPPKANDEFSLEVCVDFIDDLGRAPFTRDMFNDLFAEFKSWGVNRVYWIYYGKMADGLWGNSRNAPETYKNVGEIFDAAVKAAHEHDISIFGLIKPLDMGGWLRSYGEATPEAKSSGRMLQRIGGPVVHPAKFPAEHRELVMSRRAGAYGPSKNKVFTRIDLVKEDDLPCDLSVNDIKLYVSDDNSKYHLYTGLINRKEAIEGYPVYIHTPSGAKQTKNTQRSRVFRLDNLDIKNKYIALSVEGRQGSFANSLINLIHVFGDQGEENLFTYGIMPRKGVSGKPNSFQQNSFEFDKLNGPPTAIQSGGFEAVCSTFVLDSGSGAIALARGKDRGTLAALSPSFSQTRQWWLSWVRDVLEAGADGVELRVSNHHAHLAWREYGFETPVVDSFKQRYGVDISKTDDFDRTAFYKLRGEGYTQFYRQAKELANSYGKPLGLHINLFTETEPEQGPTMGIHWDWRSWLKEGLADSVTLKDMWPNSRMAQEIFSYTRPRGITVASSIFTNYWWSGTPDSSDGAVMVENLIRTVRDSGCDSYRFYECAAVIEATTDGKIVMQHPRLRELFQKIFVEK